jgi:alpha-beta hydrolase superfamily lysophospholipase
MALTLPRTTEESISRASGHEIFIRSWRPETPARAVVVICHGVNSHSGCYTWTAEQRVTAGKVNRRHQELDCGAHSMRAD